MQSPTDQPLTLAVEEDEEARQLLVQVSCEDTECVSVQFEVGEEVEEVMEMLLCALRDSKGVVRWSAAKGLGRVTNRLSSSLADDVLQSILTCFRSVGTCVCYLNSAIQWQCQRG